MQLYLVRHADATPGNPDELRPLSDEGREQARELGEQLRADGVVPDVVAHPLPELARLLAPFVAQRTELVRVAGRRIRVPHQVELHALAG